MKLGKKTRDMPVVEEVEEIGEKAEIENDGTVHLVVEPVIDTNSELRRSEDAKLRYVKPNNMHKMY